MKLNQFISTGGFCSRRKAAQLIKDGQVKVDGRVVTAPWLEVSRGASVSVGGKALKAEKKAYLIFNKPKGVTTTLEDRFADKKISDFFPRNLGRLYPAGRLDKLSRGIIILTNDGDLCYRLTHPKFEVEKEYEVLLKGKFDDKLTAALKRGVSEGGDMLRVGSARVEKLGECRLRATVVVREGKKRHIRRLFEALGFKVVDLRRVRIGGLKLDGLKEGKYRAVSKDALCAMIYGKNKIRNRPA